MLKDAYALAARSTGRLQDFKPDELKEGMVFYFEQSANLSGKAIYRAHIGQASEDKLVFDIENVSEMRYLFVALFHSGEMQSIYFWASSEKFVGHRFAPIAAGSSARGAANPALSRGFSFLLFVADHRFALRATAPFYSSFIPIADDTASISRPISNGFCKNPAKSLFAILANASPSS